jgi:hypothetical protein
MSSHRSVSGALAIVLLLLLGTAARGQWGIASMAGGDGDGARYRLRAADARAASVAVLPARGELRFAPGTAPSDEQLVRSVVAEARPAARRLVDLVAGTVTISLGRPGPGAAGVTSSTDAGYAVELDLGGVYRVTGIRGVRRLVLHELAHVVDFALVPHALEARLDAATPPGFGCDGGVGGGCAAREERFAESFAKWATGDIGAGLDIGYRVPPPLSLAGWGDPLAALTR